MIKNYFMFKGRRYYIGTLIKINENQKENFNYYSIVEFIQYDDNNNLYCFNSPYEPLRMFKITDEQISIYIKEIINGVIDNPANNNKTEPKYIDGMFNAWIWYILVMFFALFIKGIYNTIILWITASIIFFRWRNNKINRG